MPDKQQTIAEMRASLARWDRELADAEKHLDQAEDAVRATYGRQLGELREHHARATDLVDEVERSSGEAWDALSQRTKDSFSEFERSLRRARESIGSARGPRA